MRQFVVFVVRAHQRPLTELAELFGLSRETVHRELRTAIRTVSLHGAPAAERPTPASGRPYKCPEHPGNCPARCSYLRCWLASFDRERQRALDGSLVRSGRVEEYIFEMLTRLEGRQEPAAEVATA